MVSINTKGGGHKNEEHTKGLKNIGSSNRLKLEFSQDKFKLKINFLHRLMDSMNTTSSVPNYLLF